MSTFKQARRVRNYFPYAFLLVAMALSNFAKAGLQYDVIDLGKLLPQNSSSGFYYLDGVSPAGLMVGLVSVSKGSRYDHAFVRDQSGKITDLGTLGGNYTYAGDYFTEGLGNSINTRGQVTGQSTIPGDRQYHAFVTERNGKMIDLGTLGGDNSLGQAINDNGQVAGGSNIKAGDTDTSHAFVTNRSGQMLDLGTLGGINSNGNDLNASGQVTGWAETADRHRHAFITNGSGQLIDLGTLNGQGESVGNAINNHGQVTGRSFYSSSANGHTVEHVFITDNNGRMIDLGTLDKEIGGNHSSFSAGIDINDLGQVIGYSLSTNGFYASFVADKNEMLDINTLLFPNALNWRVTRVSSIDDAGQIFGYGEYEIKETVCYKGDYCEIVTNKLGTHVLLIPHAVPIPATFWLFGVGLLGWLGFDRRKKMLISQVFFLKSVF